MYLILSYYHREPIGEDKMIKKWKVTPVSSNSAKYETNNQHASQAIKIQQPTNKVKPITIIRPITTRQRSLDNSMASIGSVATQEGMGVVRYYVFD